MKIIPVVVERTKWPQRAMGASFCTALIAGLLLRVPHCCFAVLAGPGEDFDFLSSGGTCKVNIPALSQQARQGRGTPTPILRL